MKVPIADWKVTRKQKKLMNEVLNSGRLTYGSKTKELEERFAEIHGRKYALFTNSGTSALQVVLHYFKRKYGWKDGDEVIIPAVTFVATMNVVLQNNLKPVLVDVDLDDISIDPVLLERALTSRTVAVIPVHLFGQSAEMDTIMKIAKRHHFKVIEDSCETMFVKYKNRPVGSRGDAACFSSYLAHIMVTGVGGFITTNDKKDSEIMRSMMFHGRHESYLNIDSKEINRRFLFTRPGYSYRATEMEAAIGLGELDTYEKNIKQRQKNAEYLMNGLSSCDTVFPIREIENHAFMFFPILVTNRDKLIDRFESKGIQTRTMMPLTSQPWVKEVLGDIEDDYPDAKFVNEHGILIGCHQYLSQKQLDYIIEEAKCVLCSAGAMDS
jgi:dTDP-4-amino-4,6-dideoxygalactose transaminase